MDKLKTGEWIKVYRHRFEGYVGFVVMYDFLKDLYNVLLVRNAKEESLENHISFWIRPEQVKLAEVESIEGLIPHLIDMALDTRDFDWILQLKQLEEK